MTIRSSAAKRVALFCSAAALMTAGSAWAQTAATTAASTEGAIATATTTDGAVATAGAATEEVVVTAQRTTRSAVSLSGSEIQKLLPGANPLKSIETLPGVTFQTADPWGLDEQNEEIFVHGFSTQQLGYTFDGLPLGDQQYGGYNSLSPSRAVTSENVSRVELSSGAGALGTPSTSNLGAVIETFSRDPSGGFGVDARVTAGSYQTQREFFRIDTGADPHLFGGTAYFSFLNQSARAWDFHGDQSQTQANLKYVRDDPHGKLTLYADYSIKTLPNEDAESFGNQQTAAAANFIPYTRPYLYPNASQISSYYFQNPAQPGTPPVGQGNNFSNYDSAEQRQDDLAYAKYDWRINSAMNWTNQAYYHYDYGRGIVAGPINNAGLPALFATYFPNLVVGGSSTSTGTLNNLINLFGGSGLEVRTTEYHINRGGIVSTFDWTLGANKIEAGVWYEHNDEGQHRVWYPFSAANDDTNPYDTPKGPAIFTQDAVDFSVDDAIFHLQDQWQILPTLLLQAGFKTSYQNASNTVLVQQIETGGNGFPQGTIQTTKGFLPQVGGVWDFTPHEQLFANVQQNVRQFIPYSQGGNFYGTSPWSLGNQAAFNLFKSTVQPETAWTYEVGVRTKRTLDLGLLTGIEGQVNYYHVDFSNRILNIAPYNFINPAPSILVNVGSVTSDGVDAEATLHFGEHFSLYDAFSYDKSTYDQNYNSGQTGGMAIVIPVAGKQIPGEPQYTNKTILSTSFGPFEAQVSGDYLGNRFATYENDLHVGATFQVGLEASYRFDHVPLSWVRGAKFSVNGTNLLNRKGISTLVPTSLNLGYQGYPVAPQMFFATLQANF